MRPSDVATGGGASRETPASSVAEPAPEQKQPPSQKQQRRRKAMGPSSTAMTRMSQREQQQQRQQPHDDDVDGADASTRSSSSEPREPATTATSATTTTTTTDTRASTGARSSHHYKEGIRLAEMGDWALLMQRLQAEPQLARHRDHHGMLPLHWACTEAADGGAGVDAAVIRALLHACPEAVLTRNNAQFLPIHLAVRVRAPEELLRLLCEASPSSLLEETPAGKTPLALAIEGHLPASTIALLRRAQAAYEGPLDGEDDDDDEDVRRAIEVQSLLLRESMLLTAHPAPELLGRRLLPPHPEDESATTITTATTASSSSASPSPSTSYNAGSGGQLVVSTMHGRPTPTTRYYSDALMPIPMIDEEGAGAPQDLHGRYPSEDAGHRHQPPPPASGHQHVPAPPAGRPTATSLMRATEGDVASYNSGVCGVCYKKFSVFRKKHQCRSCFAFICRKHVAGKIDLPSESKRRSEVCAECYILHRHGGTAAATAAAASHQHQHRPQQQPLPGQYQQQQQQQLQQQPPSTTVGFSHTAVPTAPMRSTALATVPSQQAPRRHRTESTPSITQRSKSWARQHSQQEPTEMRHTTILGGGGGADANNSTSVQYLKPMTSPPPPTSQQQYRALDRLYSNTTMSLSDSERNSAEVAALHHRVAMLEEQNKLLLSRLAEQETQYDDCMLLLTQTMTRVAEMEMRAHPGGRPTHTGTDSAFDTDSEVNPASFDFGYAPPPLPPLTSAAATGQ